MKEHGYSDVIDEYIHPTKVVNQCLSSKHEHVQPSANSEASRRNFA